MKTTSHLVRVMTYQLPVASLVLRSLWMMLTGLYGCPAEDVTTVPVIVRGISVQQSIPGPAHHLYHQDAVDQGDNVIWRP